MIEFKQIIGRGTRLFDGKPISVEEFLNNLYGALPSYFQSEEELRQIWSNPITRKALLDKLADAGYEHSELAELQKLVGAEKSDLFDVLDQSRLPNLIGLKYHSTYKNHFIHEKHKKHENFQ